MNHYEMLLPGIKGLAKSKLRKVKGILKNRCSWNIKTYDVSEFQKHLYFRTSFNYQDFKKRPPRGVPRK